MTGTRIIVVDDDETIRALVAEALRRGGHDVLQAGTCADAEKAIGQRRFDAAVLDYELPDGNALQILPQLKAANPPTPIVILTGYATISLAVQAIKEGADQFLTKPVEMAVLRSLVERLIQVGRSERWGLVRAVRARSQIDPFGGTGAAVRQLAVEAAKVAQSDSAILIQGETGSGKGVLAAWLHRHSRRAEEPFVDLNCAGLAHELLASELFGHARGAFTGAVAAKPGLFEVADRGTVFLDEIGDVDQQVQPKLLKVLEERRFRRLGEVRDREVDVRLIAATHQDLRALVETGRFRTDLYYRINALPLVVPPLRERAEDIAGLAEALLARVAGELGRPQARLHADAVAAMQVYQWPGNVRELRNVLERALLFAVGDVLRAADLRFEGARSSAASSDTSSNRTLAEVERLHIERVLREEDGRVVDAARRLGIPRSSLYHKLKQLGITGSSV